MNGGVMIGIDAGTSKVKTNLFDLQGNSLRELSIEVHLHTPAHNQVELDVTDLFAKLAGTIRQLVIGYEGKVQAIGFSVASPTLVLMDRELNAVRPGIVYLDNRSIAEVEKTVQLFGGKEAYFKRVGNNPSPSTCVAATINWLRAMEPESWARTYRIGFLNSYLAAQLTGELAVDPTVASYSGLMDVKNPTNWDAELVQLFGIERERLPPVVPAYSKVGTLNKPIAEVLGLSSGIPVAIGGADTAVTSFALGLRQHGDTFQSMGTSEVLTFCLDRPDFNPAFMNRSHVIPGRWLAHGAMSTAGAAVGWLLNKIFPEFDAEKELEEEAADSPSGANGVVFVPYLCGERSPIFDPRASGVFFGLQLATRRADMIRAVFEGVAYGMRQIYSIGREQWGISPSFIKCVGGASKSDLAVRLRADALNKEFRTIEADDTASYGAALLGAVAAGLFSGFEQVPYLDHYGKAITPNSLGVQHFSNHCHIYNSLYPNLKALMQQHHSDTSKN